MSKQKSKDPMDDYLGDLSEGSKPAIESALKIVAGIYAPGVAPAEVAWHKIRREDVNRIKRSLQRKHTAKGEQFKPATINRILSALRGVLREAWGLGLMRADDYNKARRVKLVAGTTEMIGRSIKQSEFERLFAACDDTPAGNRDATLIALLYGCGLRRAEAAAVALADYDRGENTLKVHGKGRKERTVNLPVGARRAVDAWLGDRGRAGGALICPVNKNGKITIRHMTPAAVWDALKRRVKKAKLARLTPHDCRRSFASDQIDAGTHLVTLQLILGHADPKTSARYDRSGDRRRAAAADSIKVPFGR